jgi:hypothetical protein
MRTARSILAALSCLAITAGVVLVAAAPSSASSGSAVLPSGGGTQVIEAHALDDHECNSTEWHFVITGIVDGIEAPASIHVTWANGDSADVPLDTVTGEVAHYSTTLNLDSTVTSATAVIDDAWDGQFNLSHGPCGNGTTTTTEATTSTTEGSTTTSEATTSTSEATTSTSGGGSTSSSVLGTSTSQGEATTAATVLGTELARTGSPSATYTVWGICLLTVGAICLGAQASLKRRSSNR